MDKKPYIIAFYLPQFHPTPDNNRWWGIGFTEWTNVGKAKPLFYGHYQPRVPADLGYYDLRLPEIRERQVELAKEAGIGGFCYYHYWFGNGKRELELPFNEVLKSGQPIFPFCLCWANESWHSKFWNNDGSCSSKLLIEQKYLGESDYTKHFYELLPAFKDKRYIKIDGKPLFMIYRPLDIPDSMVFINLWQNLAKQNGLDGIYFCAHTSFEADVPKILSMKYDSVNIVRLWDCMRKRPIYKKIVGKIVRSTIYPHPFIISYKRAKKFFLGNMEKASDNIFPTMIPNWDHSPRSGKGGYVITNSTPELFKEHAKEVLGAIGKKDCPIVFLKSWNEWGEGNYMEPDLRFGKGYIEALHDITAK